MKSKALALFLFLSLASVTYVFGQHFWRGETLSIKKVEKKWGNADFQPEKFKIATPIERAKMTYSLIQSKKYIGNSVSTIRKELGDPDGYYFSDVYPAYIITESGKKGDDIWQIVFLIDNLRNVSDVIVHKNCCYSR